MTLNVSTLSRQIQHAIGGAHPSQDIGAEVDLINEAGTIFYSMALWDFNLRMATVGVVAGQSYATLPSDFGSIEAIEATDTLTNSVHLTSPKELLHRKTYTLDQSNFNFYATVLHADNADASDGPPVERLELHPTPTATDATIFTMVYHQRWPKIADDSDNVSVPEYCETLFRLVCREVAKGYEADRMNDRNALTLDDRISKLQSGATFANAIDADARVQHEYGQIENGHISSGAIYRDLGLHTTIADPT